ncbi:MAG: OmpH family outer membrane protein, partial [Saprospiraceae bacterium]
MPKSIVLLIISLSTLLLLGGWWVQQPALHVGVIRMEKLVYDYAGMKDATKAYTGQLATWNAEVDSLGKEIQALRAAPGTSAGGDKQSRLARLEGNYQALQQQFNERANS